jgi:hypothetical protein
MAQKYKIIDSIPNDPPFGDMNFYTISFLTPATKQLQILGFKVYYGYTNKDMPADDVKIIQSKDNKHNVHIGEMGKLHNWNDLMDADETVYENTKLNQLEKKRKENADTAKLIQEQFGNEMKSNLPKNRANQMIKRLQHKLHEKGMVTQKQLDEINTINSLPDDVESLIQNIDEEINKAYEIDYLTEEPTNALKWGCISIYTPKKYKGCKQTFYKVRGLFGDKAEAQKRANKLKAMNDWDNVSLFKVGFWNVYSDYDQGTVDEPTLLKQLNYTMKCYIDNLSVEKEEFEKRKAEKIKETEQDAELVKQKNRAERRKEMREKMKNHVPTTAEPVPASDDDEIYFTEADRAAIREIYEYLYEPELENRYALEKKESERIEIAI